MRLDRNCFECNGRNTWCPTFKGEKYCQWKENMDKDLKRYENREYNEVVHLKMLVDYLSKNEI